MRSGGRTGAPDVPVITRTAGATGRSIPGTSIKSAAGNFAERLLFGSGLGTNPAEVTYVDPAGGRRFMTDAHNVFLNIAAQCGLIGLAALAFLIASVFGLARPLRLDDQRVIPVALAAPG